MSELLNENSKQIIEDNTVLGGGINEELQKYKETICKLTFLAVQDFDYNKITKYFLDLKKKNIDLEYCTTNKNGKNILMKLTENKKLSETQIIDIVTGILKVMDVDKKKKDELLNQKDKNGNTLIHYSVKNKRHLLTELLINEYGFNPKHKNNDGVYIQNLTELPKLPIGTTIMNNELISDDFFLNKKTLEPEIIENKKIEEKVIKDKKGDVIRKLETVTGFGKNGEKIEITTIQENYNSNNINEINNLVNNIVSDTVNYDFGSELLTIDNINKNKENDMVINTEENKKKKNNIGINTKENKNKEDDMGFDTEENKNKEDDIIINTEENKNKEDDIIINTEENKNKEDDIIINTEENKEEKTENKDTEKLIDLIKNDKVIGGGSKEITGIRVIGGENNLDSTISDQIYNIHKEVNKKIMKLMNVDEKKALLYKSGLWMKIIEKDKKYKNINDPKLDLKRCLLLLKMTNLKNLKTINIDKVKKKMSEIYKKI